MKLNTFRIRNYKSIVDSGICQVADDFTVLIGKNESGKTAVLEALRDFDREMYGIEDKAYPLADGAGEPVLQMNFTVSQQDLDYIEKISDVPMLEEISQFLLEEGLNIEKSTSGEYRLLDSIVDGLFGELPLIDEDEETVDDIHVLKAKLDSLFTIAALPDLITNDGSEELQRSIQEIRKVVKSRLLMIRDEMKREEIVETLREMTKTVGATALPQTQKRGVKEHFTDAVIQQIPRFAFISDFNDILPFEVPIAELKQNRAILDFAQLANLDLDALMNTDDLQRRINILNRHSASISGEFFGFWEQNKIELIVRTEGDRLLFGVKEADKTELFKVEQRSKGFQWFLSFYLKISSFKNKNVVILIDEPGMNLHPAAQKDLLKVLEKTSVNKLQVVLSTHSFCLIDPERLDRIRLIARNSKEGTRVIADLEADVDAETFLPVKLALQLEIPATEEIVKENDSVEEFLAEEETSLDFKIEKEPEPVAELDFHIETASELDQAKAEEEAEIDQLKEQVLEEAESVEDKPKQKRSLFGFFKKKDNAVDEEEKAEELEEVKLGA